VYGGGIITTETYGRANGLGKTVCTPLTRVATGRFGGYPEQRHQQAKDGNFTTYTTTNGLALNAVSAILEGHDGTMWFGTPNGLSALSNGKWRPIRSKMDCHPTT